MCRVNLSWLTIPVFDILNGARKLLSSLLPGVYTVPTPVCLFSWDVDFVRTF